MKQTNKQTHSMTLEHLKSDAVDPRIKWKRFKKTNLASFLYTRIIRGFLRLFVITSITPNGRALNRPKTFANDAI